MDVTVNHENDTCSGNRVVMGSADCLYYAGLVKTPEKLFKRTLGPLPDTLQAGACVFPPFEISLDHLVKMLNTRSIPPVPAYGSIWAVLWQPVSG